MLFIGILTIPYSDNELEKPEDVNLNLETDGDCCYSLMTAPCLSLVSSSRDTHTPLPQISAVRAIRMVDDLHPSATEECDTVVID